MFRKSKSSEKRVVYLAAVSLTILLGLSSRVFQSALPTWVGLYLGDLLWAMMVYWGISIFLLRASFLRKGIIALSVAYVIELSQLYQADWINAIRSTRLGGLLLGFGFLWTDLVCYWAGVSGGMVIDRKMISPSRTPLDSLEK